ncbi:glycosyltransferase family 4 protein [soil metagenome]
MERFDQSVSPLASIAGDGIGTDVALFLKGSGPGGVERTALRLVAGWRATGVGVSLTVGVADGALTPGSGMCQVSRAWPVVGTRWPLTRLTWSMWRHLRRDRPAILFCPGNSYTLVAVLLKTLLGRACPLIVAKISNDLERHDMPRAVRPFYRAWLLVQGRMIDHFAVLSAPMGAQVARLMHVATARVHVVPNPVLSHTDWVSIERADKPVQLGRRFVAVGRLERQKDYPAMLRAFASGAKADDRLTICGEGRERDALARLTGSLGIAERVHFAGHRADIRKELCDHDVLLLTSLYEGQPSAVVEALSVGLAIVATRCCAGMAELLDNGALGTLVESGDAVALARAVARAVPGQQDRARACAKARSFSIEAAIPAYMALFARVIAERQARDAALPAAPQPLPSKTLQSTSASPA